MDEQLAQAERNNEELPDFVDEDGVHRFWYHGACHCRGIRFSAAATRDITITVCNCSICHQSGHQEIMVRESHFRLHEGQELLRAYRFGSHRAEHTFCTRCGIKPFYRPRSHPVGFRSVNARCLDLTAQVSITFSPFDGRNWETSIASGHHRLTL